VNLYYIYCNDMIECVNAVWGGLLTARAAYLNVNGAVVWGNCRDQAEINAMNFPVFSRSVSSLGASGFTRPSATQVPLTFKHGGTDVVVNPGDFIIADIDGVVRIPHALLAQVIHQCTIARDVDAKCLAAIQQGTSITDAFQTYRNK
jgi:regulator of RNase E activity RraA